ncbi:MAG: Rid family detoxifying hydrolase [Lactimicrobium sp.]|jgi:2-iminobutanoate/2-iminopropanoate deaminase|uniref:RidA family protein n=1 Tax=Lactimicrobium sp. TaxID=2563780 RepID=UPI002F34F0C7
MIFETLQTQKAPHLKGAYSPALSVCDYIFISGQLPLEDDNTLTDGDIACQTKRCIENLQHLLALRGLDLSYAVQVRVYLSDMNDYARMDTVFQQMFHDPYPARTVIGVNALPMGAKIQMEAYAMDTRAMEILCAQDEQESSCHDGYCSCREK